MKVVHKKLYYRQKGVIESVHDKFTALVRMNDSGDKVKFDQAHLETVIPAIGMYIMCLWVTCSTYGLHNDRYICMYHVMSRCHYTIARIQLTTLIMTARDYNYITKHSCIVCVCVHSAMYKCQYKLYR